MTMFGGNVLIWMPSHAKQKQPDAGVWHISATPHGSTAGGLRGDRVRNGLSENGGL